MAIIPKPINEVQPPNSLSSETEGAVDVPNNLSAETEGAVGVPNALTSETEGQVGLPNSLSSETEGVVLAPNALSSQSEGQVGLPNSLSSQSEGVVAVPNALASETEGVVGLPNSLSSEAVVDPSVPNNLTSQSAAAVSRALRPLVDMHFDDQCFTQCGEPVSFDDLFTYSRNSSASFINRRIGCNGGYEFFLDTDFVGTVTNLFTFSEQFEDGDWVKSAATINADDIKSPFGDKTADKLIASATNANHQAAQVPVLASSTSVVFSVFAKAGGHDRLVLIPTADDGTTEKTWFNLSAGVIELAAASHVAKITDEGDGWYQCSVGFDTGVGATANDCRIRIGKAGLVDSFLGDGIDGIHIWGAQVTESFKLQPYVKTISSSAMQTFTESLRIEYNASTGENLAALIEGASTNLFLKSEEFNISPWVLSASSISVNDSIAPDETISADKIIADSTAAIAPKMSQSITSVTSEKYTTSFYVKKSEATFVQIFYGGGHVANDPRVNFDLSLGVLGTQDADIDAATITDNGDGFFRITSTVTAAGVALQSFLLIIQSSGVSRNLAQSWTAGEGVHVWGAQVEQQPFATSYIRTEGSTVARAADDLTIPVAGNIPNTNSDATIFSDISFISLPSGGSGARRHIYESDADANDALIRISGIGNLEVLHGSTVKSVGSFGESISVAYVFDSSANTLTGFLDGESFSSSDAGNAFSPDISGDISIGQNNSSAEHLFGHIQKFTIFDEALTAQEVALL